jgi:microcystin-dependent protein
VDEIIRRLAALELELEKLRAGAAPTGAIQAFATRSAPEGWLPCDGSEVSRQQYARLFQAIGTTFGEGDGETTFHLPDLQGMFVRGWDAWGDVDPERKFGTLQEDTFQGHRHASLGHLHSADCQSAGAHDHKYGGYYKKNITVAKSSTFGGTYSMYEPWAEEKTTGKAGDHQHSVNIFAATEVVTSPERADCGEPRVDTETRPKNIALLYCIRT